MIITRIGSTLASISNTHLCFFYTKGVTSPRTFVKNENLTFDDPNYKLTTYFFLPEMRKTQGQTYEISKYSNVLSFLWQPKVNGKVQERPPVDNKSKQVPNKLSFSFRYQQLQPLLQVLPKSNATTTIEKKKNNAAIRTHQTLTLIDNPEKKIIHYNYKSIFTNIGEEKEHTSKADFQFSYSQHRIFQILLRQSLFELSGMGIIYELKRDQEINSAQNEALRKIAEIDNEVKEYYK